MMLPLISGARVVIAGRDEVIDGEKLIRLIDEYDVSIMQATPATWRLLVESPMAGQRQAQNPLRGRSLDKGSGK